MAVYKVSQVFYPSFVLENLECFFDLLECCCGSLDVVVFIGFFFLCDAKCPIHSAQLKRTSPVPSVHLYACPDVFSYSNSIPL